MAANSVCVRFLRGPQPSGPDYGRSPRIAKSEARRTATEARSGAVLRVRARDIYSSDGRPAPARRRTCISAAAQFAQGSPRIVEGNRELFAPLHPNRPGVGAQRGLPVHRLQHSKCGSLYAFRSELDKWQAQRTVAGQAPASGSGTGRPSPRTCYEGGDRPSSRNAPLKEADFPGLGGSGRNELGVRPMEPKPRS